MGKNIKFMGKNIKFTGKNIKFTGKKIKLERSVWGSNITSSPLLNIPLRKWGGAGGGGGII